MAIVPGSLAKLTLLTTVGGILAVKTFRKGRDGDIEVEGYGRAKRFKAREIEVDERGEWLVKLGPKFNSFVVLGEPVDWKPGEVKRRLSSERDGAEATLRDVPRTWMPVDVDRIDFEPLGEISDGGVLAPQVMNRFGLKGSRCVWHLTGGHGFDEKVRIRLWLRLSRPLTCTQMKAFAKARWDDLADLSVYRPAQPIYTGDPVLKGVASPVAERVGCIEGNPVDVGDVEMVDDEPRSDRGDDDPNIALLRDAGLYIRRLRAGQHAIRCPWESEHTDGVERDDDTFYFEPHTNRYPGPGFKCHHGHCDGRRWRDVLSFLGRSVDGSVDTAESFEPVTTDSTHRRAAQSRRVDDFVSYLPDHRYPFLSTMALWPGSSVDACVPRQKIKGNAKAVRASAWLDLHRPVHSMTWKPGEGLLIEGQVAVIGGWKPDPNATSLNTYLPPKKLDGDARQSKRWREHLCKVFPEDAEHVERYFAHRVQRPGEKVNHALVLAGDQGIGKDTLLEPLKQAVGPWNFAEVGPTNILGEFNPFVKSVVLRISEGRDLGDVNRFALYEHMKVYTAAPPDTLRCNEKHLREHYVFNVMGVVITTNHRSDGLYLPQDDRRHYVATSSLTKEDFAEDYWRGLWTWYRDENGFGHVAAYLRNVNLSDFDPAAPPPKTPGWHTIVAANNAPEDIELAAAIEELGEPDALTLEMLREVAPTDLRIFLDDRRSKRAIAHRLVAAGYSYVQNPGAKNGLWRFPTRLKGAWHSGQKSTVKVAAYAKRALSPADAIKAVRALTELKPKPQRKPSDDVI